MISKPFGLYCFLFYQNNTITIKSRYIQEFQLIFTNLILFRSKSLSKVYSKAKLTFVLNCDYQSFSMFGVSESLCFSDYIKMLNIHSRDIKTICYKNVPLNITCLFLKSLICQQELIELFRVNFLLVHYIHIYLSTHLYTMCENITKL